MSNKSIYAWDVDENASAAMIREEFLKEIIFKKATTVEESIERGAYRKWADNEKTDLSPRTKFQILIRKNTDRWYQEKYPIPCRSSIKKEVLEEFDFMQVINFVPTVSTRVYEMMMELCPDDFEAFDVTIDTPSGRLEGYKLINIKHLVFDAMDIDRCVFWGTYYLNADKPHEKLQEKRIAQKELKQMYQEIENGSYNSREILKIVMFINYLTLKSNAMRSHDLGRLAEMTNRCMFSQRLINEFKRMNANGFLYTPLEDHASRLYGGKIPQ
jgi:hypothetical protein